MNGNHEHFYKQTMKKAISEAINDFVQSAINLDDDLTRRQAREDAYKIIGEFIGITPKQSEGQGDS